MSRKYDLFDLVHSLSPKERTFLKSKGKKGSSYMVLFNNILAQEEYDEQKLIKKLGSKTTKNSFSKLKGFLSDFILTQMIYYHELNNLELSLTLEIRKCDFLIKKGFYEEAKKQLLELNKKCEEHDLYRLQIRIYDFLFYLYVKGLYGNTYPFKKEFLHVTEQSRKEYELQAIYFEIVELMFKDSVVSFSDKKEKITKLLKNTTLESIVDTDAFSLKYNALSITSDAYSLLNDRERTLKECEKKLKLMSDNPKITNTNIGQVIMMHEVYINDLIDVGYFEKVPLYLEKLRNIQPEKSVSLEEVNKLKYSLYYMQSLSYLTKTGAFKEAEKLCVEIEPWLEKYSGKFSEYVEVPLIDYMVLVYLGVGNYRKALKYSYQLINNKYSMHEERLLWCSINNLILHFELKNLELLPYTITNLYRKFNRFETDLVKEKKVLKALKKVLRNQGYITSEELNKSFKILKNELDSYQQNNPDFKSKNTIVFLTWLEYRGSKIPFSDVYKRAFTKEEAPIKQEG